MAKTCPTCSTKYPDTVVFCPADGSGLITVSGRDDLIGEVIADTYLVTNLLGQGGMGTVYHAQHVRLPMQVAIKILHANRSSDPAQASRFRQEAESASRIDHDRVARVYDFGTTASGEAYIAMEYVPGRTLASLIEERGALDPFDAAQIVFMVAEGLDAAHRIGIIHRDLKPENIMIVDDAEGSIRVKVLDFGIAKMMSGPKNATLTQHGFIIGSPSYMSPEQVMGETLDARSDVYALGLLAFVMLTGARPFSGNTPEAEMLARLTGAPRSLTEVAPAVAWPADLQAGFDRTLSRDVPSRPARAKAFADEFFNSVSAWKAVTRPVGMMASGSISRPPFTLSPPVTGGATVAEQAVLAVPRRRSTRWGIAAVALLCLVAGSAAAYRITRNEKRPAGEGEVAGSGQNSSKASAVPASTGATGAPVSGGNSLTSPDKILAPREAERVAPVTVDITKPDPRKNVATVSKSPANATPPVVANASGSAPVKVPVVDSAAGVAAGGVIRPPSMTADSKAASPEIVLRSNAELSNELKETVRSFAIAIESHDVGRLKAAFPGISHTLLDQYGSFFQFASSIKVAINSLDTNEPLTGTVGSVAHARVKVTINYRNDSNRKDEHNSAVWQTALTRTANGWILNELK